MKKRILFLLFVLLPGVTGLMAQSMARYFIQMPLELIPTVSLDTRKDLIDFYNNGKSAAMRSAFGGEVVLKELSDDYLLIQTSDNADLQLKLLKVNDTLQVIALVHTVAAPLKDSRMEFYTTSWKPLHDISFPVLSFMDFLDTEKAKALGLTGRLGEVCLRNFVSFQFHKNTSTLIAHSSIKEDIRPEILKEFEPVIKDSLSFAWEKGRFHPIYPEK